MTPTLAIEGNEGGQQSQVVVSNIFLFLPLPGEMVQFDDHIF